MGNFFLVPVNYLAVLVCGVINMAVGFLWYGPFFGREWRRLVGRISQKNEDMMHRYLLTFLGSLLTAYVLFHFIWYAAPGNYTLFIAVKTAVWGWLGLVLPTSLTKHLFTTEKKPWKLLFIETGYHLAGLMVMATVFYFFK